jgi:hypothetical protein
MKSIKRIIKEEYLNFVKEGGNDDIDYAYFEREDELKQEMFSDFLYNNNPTFTKHVPWSVIPFPRLKKVWEDYMTYGSVRDTRGLEMIEEIVMNNIMKINIFTNLAGHTQWGDEEAFEENIGYFVDEQLSCIFDKPADKNQLQIPFNNPEKEHEIAKDTSKCNGQVYPFVKEYVDDNYNGDSVDREDIRGMLFSELKEKFFDYYMSDEQQNMGGFISDYGLEPLVKLSGQLRRDRTPEEKLITIDKILNVVHQRSDIAYWFVEGGSRALSQLSGYKGTEGESSISGEYKRYDYV